MPEPLSGIRRLRLVYFAFLGGLGLVVTWLPYHLIELGLSASQIGALFAGRTAISIVSQPFVTAASERARATRRALQLALVWSAILAAAVPFARTFGTMAIALWVAMPLQGAVGTLVESRMVRQSGEHGFGRSRAWGSLGYGLVVWGFGMWMHGASSGEAGALSLPLTIALFGVAAVAGAALPAGNEPRTVRDPLAFARLALAPRLLVFMLWNGVHWGTIMAWNVFFALHVRDLGLGNEVPGSAVMAAVGSEVVALFLAGRLLERFRPETWMAPIFLLTAARWLGTAWSTSAAALIAWQLLHAASFGLWYVGAIALLGRHAPQDERASLQGVFGAVCLGLGSMVGTTLAGILMDASSGRRLFEVAAGAELVAIALMWGTRRWWYVPVRESIPAPIAET